MTCVFVCVKFIVHFDIFVIQFILVLSWCLNIHLHCNFIWFILFSHNSMFIGANAFILTFAWFDYQSLQWRIRLETFDCASEGYLLENPSVN